MADSKKNQPASRARANVKARAAVAKSAVKKLPKPAVKSKAQGFADFIRKQGVIGLAVGLAIGTQAGTTVKAIVEGFINPIVAFVVGSDSGLADAKWNIVGVNKGDTTYLFHVGDRVLVFSWGSIFSSLITLLAVAGVIYFVVMGLRLDKLDKKKD